MLRRHFALAPLVVVLTSMLAPAEEFRGVISKVDADHQEIVVEGRGLKVRGLSLHFQLGADARISLGHAVGRFADLQPGERVRLFYEVRDGQRMALSMTVHGARKPAAPPAAAPADVAVAPPPANDANTVAGSLIRVAVTEREIVVVSPGAGGVETETTLTVPDKVKITKDGKAMKLEDLKDGEQVTVKTEKQNGKSAAVAIQVGLAAAAAPAQPQPQRMDRIERIRMLLKLADWVLQQAQQNRQDR